MGIKISCLESVRATKASNITYHWGSVRKGDFGVAVRNGIVYSRLLIIAFTDGLKIEFLIIYFRCEP